jgi:glycosyltransferase involved in cell wall biosynthesis
MTDSPTPGEPGRPVRVAHLTTVDSSLRYLLRPQLRAVRDRGGDSVGISAPGPYADELEAEGIRHVPLGSSTRGMNLLADVRAAAELWRILRRERPDVLHTHNPKPGIYGRIVGRLAGAPVVVNTNHGLWATEHDRLVKRLVVLALEAVAARFSHAELIQNVEDLDLLTRRRINTPSRTRLLGNGIDLDRFSPGTLDPKDRLAVRDELGAGPSTIVVGIVGRLVAEKGYPELFEAARRLDGRYLVAAVGPDEPEKADAITPAQRAAAERAGVVFLGQRDDVERLYAALDVFVLPSHREGFPRAAMEAAATGLPIVATDVRGCRQVVVDGVTGLLVPVRDPERLAAAIAELGSDPERRHQMGVAAARRAREEFDENRVVDIVLSTYREVAARRGRADIAAALAPAAELSAGMIA